MPFGGVTASTIDDADLMRAHAYALLARTLARPPSELLLTTLGGLEGDDSPLGEAFTALAEAARATDEAAAGAEYHALFIGVVQGELVPYASYYRTGLLHDRPLAELRADLEALGIERAPDVAEPEDHIAALCETMAALVDGTLGPPDPRLQHIIFRRHLAPWAGRFFADLETARPASLYRPVGTIGRLFLSIETDCFAMLEDSGS